MYMKNNFLIINHNKVENYVLYGGVDKLFLIDFKFSYRDNFCYRLITSRKTSFWIPKKLKNVIVPKVKKYADRKSIKAFDKLFENSEELNNLNCIIICARVFEYFGISIVDYVREKYPDCKIVTYLADVLSSFLVTEDDFNRAFDKVYSFDKSECRKYGFTYCLEPYSYQITEKLFGSDFDVVPQYDVTFIGAAKDRLDDILSVYEKLKVHNLKLDFWIFGVKKEDQKYKDEIHYNEYLSFEDFIRHTLNARCTFEALQKNGSSPTTRFSMCMLYKRKLLTNCTELLDSEWSDAMATGNIQVYKDMETIDFKWIKKDCEYDNQKFIERFSTDRMIETIDSTL